VQQLSYDQRVIHERAVKLANAHRKIEAELIRVLQQVDECKLHRKLGQPSLFMYATQILGLSESLAYAFITVARKCKQVVELQAAIDSRELSVSKAVRITSSLNAENSRELIDFARSHSSKEIDFEVAKRNPTVEIRGSAKAVSEDMFLLEIGVSKKIYEKLLRVLALEAQRQRNSKFEDAIDAGLEAYLEKYDPVRKAERVSKKVVVESTEPCSSKVLKKMDQNVGSRGRTPIPAAQKHAVHRRDEGRCTHRDVTGKRCNQDRWVEIHHVVPVSLGGSNDPENLTTLCSFHHDLVHQLSLPLDGQVNWLRSRSREYVA